MSAAPRESQTRPIAQHLASIDGEAAPLVARLRMVERENAQLREALSSRIVIEQAKGVLAERYRLDVEEAFAVLRKTARAHRMRIHALAAAVVNTRTTSDDLDAVALLVPHLGAIADDHSGEVV